MKPQNKQSVNSAFSFLVIFLVILGIFFGIVPLKKDLKEIEEKISIEDKKLQEVEEKIKKISELEAGEKSSISKEQIQELIPEAIKQDELINKISSFAEKNDMELRGLNFSKSGAREDFQSVVFSTTLKGSYDQLVSFLKEVENSSRFMNIESLNVQSEEGGIYSFSLNIKAFYL